MTMILALVLPISLVCMALSVISIDFMRIYSVMHNSTARAIANKTARESRASGHGGHTSWGGGGGGFSGGGFGGGVR